VVLFSGYHMVIKHYPEYALGLSDNKTDLSNMIMSFAFTMLGFLAAIITLLFGFTDKEIYKKFKRKGYLSLLFWLYYCTIFSLFVTVFLAMFGYSKNTNLTMPFNLMMISFVVNIVQIAMLTISISNLTHRAGNEPPPP